MNDLVRHRANKARLLARASDSLLGICTGLLADQVVNEAEVLFLDVWLRQHEEIRDTWPGYVISNRVRKILADERIRQDELDELKALLEQVIGGTLEQTGAVEGLSTSLPIEDGVTISIPHRSFCFTGRFAFGSRKSCELAVIQRGGRTSAEVVKTLDYLVVGNFITPDWVHTSYGRKIEKAVDYRDKGYSLKIVSETAWCDSLDLA